MSAHPQPANSGFTPGEVAVFHAEDRKAAATIIGLMAAIFVIGIGLYAIVCLAIIS